MINKIADIFEKIADILEIKNDNQFKIRAYLRAAQSLRNLSGDIEEMANEGRLEEIPGIGKDLAEKIAEYLKDGNIKHYDELARTIPSGVLEMLHIPGVGPKTVKLFYEKLNIKSMKQLEKMARSHKLGELPGVKEKTEQNILRGINLLKEARGQILLDKALIIADSMVKYLKKSKAVKKIEIAGSLRRMKEVVHDIDILVISKKPGQVMEQFVKYPEMEEILAKGETKSSILLDSGAQVDLRVVDEDCFGAALLHFTGSKDHNVQLRSIAKSRGIKLNEYNKFSTEKKVYKTLGLNFIPPELREASGEVEYALKNKFPKLIEPGDIKCDVHCHSTYSDGYNSMEEMALAAKKSGYSHLVVTDHSQSLRVANGLPIERLMKQIDEVKKLNKRLSNFTLFSGSEVDVDRDGNLDYPDEILAKLDFVIAAVHSGFKGTKEQMTRRAVRALSNKYVHSLAHPTGRLIGEREPYQVDFTAVLKTARENNKFLEINTYPKRLDLDSREARHAKEAGVMIALGSDSHRAEQLPNIKLGVAVGRRGWLEKKDVLNTLSVAQFKKRIKRK